MSDEALYSTAAQVIPVLLLALFIEERARSRARSRQESFDRLAVLALLFLGEFTAINALAAGPSNLAEGVVILAMFMGFLTLILDPLIALSRDAAPRWGVTFYPGMLLTLVVLYLAVGEDALPWLAFSVFVVLTVASIVVRLRDDVSQGVSRTGADSSEPSATDSD